MDNTQREKLLKISGIGKNFDILNSGVRVHINDDYQYNLVDLYMGSTIPPELTEVLDKYLIERVSHDNLARYDKCRDTRNLLIELGVQR